MGYTLKIFLFCIVAPSFQHVEAQLISYDECWRPEDACNNDTSIRSFIIKFDNDMVDDLKYRIRHTRPMTPPLHGTAFEYGFNTDGLQTWLNYWADNYLPNIKEREKYFNKFHHYKTRIQCLDLHFIRITPKVPSHVEIVPLLLLHSWPGSVREFYKTLPLLTAVAKDRKFALEIIAPSLPGFAFSEAATRPGMGSSEIAVIFRNLMRRLGFRKYYVQGDDWGSFIGSDMSTLFPEEVLGFHTNLAVSLSSMTLGSWALGSIKPSAVVDLSVQDRMYPLSSVMELLMRDFGYFHLQATKPDTIGVAMSDSPAGLLAYIFQKISMATRRDNYYKEDGGLYEFYTREELLDTLMVFWSTNTFTTSSRLYAETFNKRNVELGIYEIRTTVPMWSMHASDELMYQSKFLLQFKFINHLNATVINTGGHFLALEMPEVFAEDVLKAITAFRSWRTKQRDEL